MIAGHDCPTIAPLDHGQGLEGLEGELTKRGVHIWGKGGLYETVKTVLIPFYRLLVYSTSLQNSSSG